MSIDKDLIIKLIRLANNNSNEHEANLAARRVCLMLRDYKFEFFVPPSIFNPIPPRPSRTGKPETDTKERQDFWANWSHMSDEEFLQYVYEKDKEELKKRGF